MVHPSMTPVPASFRDPAGYVFTENGIHKRAILPRGQKDFRQFVESGLYPELAGLGLIVAQQEEPPRGLARILVPEQIAFISYPYEWCFSQLKDAALLTLEIQRRALAKGMSLKDASAYNVQFQGSRPIFIDTLSLEPNLGGPWVAYDQFCRHFLAPLLLMAHCWDTFNQFLMAAPGGFPLALASKLLPWQSYLRAGPLLHIHLHARAQSRGAASAPASAGSRPDRKAALVESLQSAVEALRLPPHRSLWSGYYEERSHYTETAEQFRQRFVACELLRQAPGLVFDLGANRGDYSRLTAKLGLHCVAFEMDGACAEQAYLESRKHHSDRLLPLRMDLNNPTPSLGFRASERMALHERPRASMLLALALIHHLRITGQAPLARISEFFASLGDNLILEFVPKTDPMVRAMLAHRQDIFRRLLEGGPSRRLRSPVGPRHLREYSRFPALASSLSKTEH